MGYELSHDTIAKQIFEKASVEARTRRKVEKFIRERHQAFQERSAPMTMEDIDFVQPYLDQINISESTYQLLKEEEAYHFTSRGKVMVKGKGEIAMYFVED